jgi:hypothetical protein
MDKLIALVAALLFFHSTFGQSVSRAEEEKAYTQAIKEFLMAAGKRGSKVLDTLLVGKHSDFPEIRLPTKIANTTLLLCTTAEADSIRKRNKRLVFVNIVGVVTYEQSKFLFVTFYPAYVHQYDCDIELNYDSTSHTFQLGYAKFVSYSKK